MEKPVELLGWENTRVGLQESAYDAYWDKTPYMYVDRVLYCCGCAYGLITKDPASGEDVFSGRIVIMEDDVAGDSK